MFRNPEKEVERSENLIEKLEKRQKTIRALIDYTFGKLKNLYPNLPIDQNLRINPEDKMIKEGVEKWNSNIQSQRKEGSNKVIVISIETDLKKTEEEKKKI